MPSMTRFWRRLDLEGLERFELTIGDRAIRAVSTVLCVEGSGFRLDYDWQLDGTWRTQQFKVQRYDPSGRQDLKIERQGQGWSIDDSYRKELLGAEELDLSVTPFCNTIPIRRLSDEAAADLTLDTVYVNGDDLSVTRSMQRHVRKSSNIVRYIDLGTAYGFEADLRVDADCLVENYAGLFERVHPSP